MRALSEGLRQEVKPYNIRTTVISPGAIATELPNSVTEPDDADLPPLGFARVNKVATLYENVVKPHVHHD